VHINRRHLLGAGIVIGGAALTPHLLFGNVDSDKSITLHVLETGERETIKFWSNGNYVSEGLDSINHILRDFKTDFSGAFDINLLNVLHSLVSDTNEPREIEVVQGFMTETPDDRFVKNSPNYYHSRGQAMDLRVPGVTLEHLAMDIMRWFDGGIGLYKKKNFVHLDVGAPRRWTG